MSKKGNDKISNAVTWVGWSKYESSWHKEGPPNDIINLTESDELAVEIVENLDAGLNSLRGILARLEKGA